MKSTTIYILSFLSVSYYLFHPIFPGDLRRRREVYVPDPNFWILGLRRTRSRWQRISRLSCRGLRFVRCRLLQVLFLGYLLNSVFLLRHESGMFKWVFVFRSRPVVKVNGALTFVSDSKQISLDDKTCMLSSGIRVPCVVLNTCLNFTGVGVGNTIGERRRLDLG